MTRDDLLELRDDKYREFSCKLIPNIDPETVLGVRIPELRMYAKRLLKRDPEEAERFIGELQHSYHEENLLHMFLLEERKDYGECIERLEAFLPYVTNWAVTDGHKFKAFKGNEDKLFCKIKEWTSSEHPYTLRFGIHMLMSYYLDDLFIPECNELVAKVVSEEYYVRMMQAWYFATALAKQYDATIPYLENKKLLPLVNNKTIQKAQESYRIPKEMKAYLKTLKIEDRGTVLM